MGVIFKRLRRNSYEDFRLGGVCSVPGRRNDMFEDLKADKNFVLERSWESH